MGKTCCGTCFRSDRDGNKKVVWGFFDQTGLGQKPLNNGASLGRGVTGIAFLGRVSNFNHLADLEGTGSDKSGYLSATSKEKVRFV